MWEMKKIFFFRWRSRKNKYGVIYFILFLAASLMLFCIPSTTHEAIDTQCAMRRNEIYWKFLHSFFLPAECATQFMVVWKINECNLNCIANSSTAAVAAFAAPGGNAKTVVKMRRVKNLQGKVKKKIEEIVIRKLNRDTFVALKISLN